LAFIFKTILQSGGSIINKETNTQLNKADRNNRGTSGKSWDPWWHKLIY